MFDAILSAYRWIFLHLASFLGIGWAIVALSFVCSAFMEPLMRMVAGVVRREKEYEEVILPQIAKINAAYSSDRERNLCIQRLYARYGYSPLCAVKKVLPLFIQIPFLLLTYYMLKGTAEINGVSFLFLRDLGKPDALLGGFNLLPVAMTLINVATVFATPGFTRRDWMQAVGIALLFLVLLYTAPAALLLYWTLNNVITCVRTLVAKRFEGARLLLMRIYSVKAVPHFALGCVVSNVTRPGALRSAAQDAVFAGALASLAFCAVLPVQSYMISAGMFDVSAARIAAWACVRTVVWTLVCFVPFFAGALVFGRAFKFAVVAFVMCALMEAGPLSYGLPELDGDFAGYKLSWRMVLDMAVLAFTFYAVIRGRGRTQLALCLAFAVVLAVTPLFSRGGGAKSGTIAAAGGTETLPVVSRSDVVKALKFSAKRNVIVMVLDSISAEACKDAMAQYPALAENFTGFVHYGNNLGMEWRTPPAIAGMLTGEYWDPDRESFAEYVQSVFSRRSVLWDARQMGLPVFMSAGQGGVGYASETDADDDGGGKKRFGNPFRTKGDDLFSLTIDQISMFRALPYFAKEGYVRSVSPYFVGRGNAVERTAGKFDFENFKDDVCFWPFVSEAPIEVGYASTALQILHTDGGHPPVRYDQDGNPVNVKDAEYDDYMRQCAYILKLVGRFFSRLKQRGIYDCSTIILCADHSVPTKKEELDVLSLAYPFLMVKPAHSRAAYGTVDVPTSHSRIAGLIRQLLKSDMTVGEITDALRCDNRFCRDVHSARVCDYYVAADGTVTMKEGGDPEPAIESLKPLQYNVVYNFYPDTAKCNYPDFRVMGGSRSTGQGVENTKGLMELWIRLPDIGSFDGVTLKVLPLKDAGENTIRIRTSGKCVEIAGKAMFPKTVTLKDIYPDDNGILHIVFDNTNDTYNCMVLKEMILWAKEDGGTSNARRPRLSLSAARIKGATCQWDAASNEVLRCFGKIDRGWNDNDGGFVEFIANVDFRGARFQLPPGIKYSRLLFEGRRERAHGQPIVVFVDAAGRSEQIFGGYWKDLDQEWHEYLVELPAYGKGAEIILNGGYPDRSGSEDSCYLFKNIRLVP